jgi:hypothetical protein
MNRRLSHSGETIQPEEECAAGAAGAETGRAVLLRRRVFLDDMSFLHFGAEQTLRP